MSLLISEEALEERRSIAAGPLRGLALSLALDLAEVESWPFYIPPEKALLSRIGGKCRHDQTQLTFDPFQPDIHTCPTCGEQFAGEFHHRWWVYWYQLWFAERAVHAAVLHRLGVGDFAPFATAILDGYAERYASYPNVDNVLGPTRLFFSTYLESIWLLQIAIATDLMSATDAALTDRVRDRIIEPSRAIIAQYDEGGSNRQVWNDAALFAAARLLGDQLAAEQAVFGPSGIVSQLSTGLLEDGTWYEGENYHLFAHRGLWYGVTMAEEAGLELPRHLVDRFQRGFATPFATALPDFTLPSRRDSQYKISLRQWRIAEHVELGLARSLDGPLVGALERIYRDDIPRSGTNRSTSSADAERNWPASTLTRADLSWRALLRALPALPPLEPVSPRSVLLRDQGFAVFRRNEGRTYVALDYGHSGGGHGHPDRLNLLIVDGDTRWLDDYGTGSYVDPSLHWYRSTLAHNAPLIAGKSQRSVNGELESYSESGNVGWISAGAAFDLINIGRKLIVMDDYLIDCFAYGGSRDLVDIPYHVDLLIDHGAAALEPSVLKGSHGLTDGFRFLRDTEVQRVEPGVTIAAHALSDRGERLRVWSRNERPAEWWRAVAPGPPGSGDRAFRLLRTLDESESPTSVIAWSDRIAKVEIEPREIRVSFTDGSTDVHSKVGEQWRVEQNRGTSQTSLVFGDKVERRAAPAPSTRETARARIQLGNDALTFELGGAHYRRSEQSWNDAGRPSASVRLRRDDGALRITVRVASSDLTFVPADAENPYDNEHPDVNGDGIQLHAEWSGDLGSWMLVPERDSTQVRIRPINNEPPRVSVEGSWKPAGKGYEMRVLVAPAPDAIDIVINEMPSGRVRRRGQLVLSGAREEFVYLRGDRHDASRLIELREP